MYLSRDWHPIKHPSFKDCGGPWPPHCIQDTDGARFHPDLKRPENTVVVTKGVRFDIDQYSVFDQTGLGDRLKQDRIRTLWVGGLAQDVCVLLRAGMIFHARGLINARTIQGNLDWVWPFWVRRQFDPLDKAFVPRSFALTQVNLTNRNWTAVGLPDHTTIPLSTREVR